MASKIPPEQWTESQFVDIATVLIALSERGENMSTIRAYLESHGDSLYKAFARPANHERAERFDGLNPYSATVSYGYLELFRGQYVPFDGSGTEVQQPAAVRYLVMPPRPRMARRHHPMLRCAGFRFRSMPQVGQPSPLICMAGLLKNGPWIGHPIFTLVREFTYSTSA